MKSTDGIIVGCNALLSKILEKDKMDIVGKHVSEVMPKFCDKIQNISVDCPTSEEIELEKGSGEKVIFAVRRTYYTDEKNQEAGVVTILTDITEKNVLIPNENATNNSSFNALSSPKWEK